MRGNFSPIYDSLDTSVFCRDTNEFACFWLVLSASRILSFADRTMRRNRLNGPRYASRLSSQRDRNRVEKERVVPT